MPVLVMATLATMFRGPDVGSAASLTSEFPPRPDFTLHHQVPVGDETWIDFWIYTYNEPVPLVPVAHPSYLHRSGTLLLLSPVIERF